MKKRICSSCGTEKNVKDNVQGKWYCEDCYRKYTNYCLGGEKAYEN